MNRPTNDNAVIVMRPRETRQRARLLAEEWIDYGFLPVSILPSTVYRGRMENYVVRGVVQPQQLDAWARWLGVEARRQQLKTGGDQDA